MKTFRNTIGILFLSFMAMTTFGQEQPPPQPTETPAAQNTPETVQTQPKKEGAIRIGVVLPRAQIAQPDGAAQDLGEPIRQSLISLMSASTVELVPIEAKLAATIKIEAEQKGCDFVLYSTVSRKQKSSIFGNLIKVVVPVVTSLNEPNNTAQTNTTNGDGTNQNTQTTAQSMASGIAASIKAKDTFEFEFNLTKADGKSSKAANTIKVKAAKNGEDVLSALIEQASNAILEAALKP